MVGTSGDVQEVPIHLELPRMTKDDLEDLLATDDLFVNYFNNFLSLKCFPEPLRFNKENSVFELVSEERKRLAAEIKQAYRDSKRNIDRRKKQIIYGKTIICLEPIAKSPNRPKVINTSFTVKALNREQGIEWIKAERLPAFLQSDLYLEYQLAKLVSQSHAINKSENQCFIRLKVLNPDDSLHFFHDDATEDAEDGGGEEGDGSGEKSGSRSSSRKLMGEKQEKEEEVPEYVKKLEKEKQTMIQDMFVCMSATSTSSSDSMLAYARLATDTQTSSLVYKREPLTTMVPSMQRVHSGRPSSALPSSSSYHRGLDSGLYKVPSTINDEFDVSAYTENLATDKSGAPFVAGKDNQCTKATVLDDVCVIAHEPQNVSAIYMPFPVETGEMLRCWKEQQAQEEEQERLIHEHLERERLERAERKQREKEEREEREANEEKERSLAKELEDGEEGEMSADPVAKPQVPQVPQVQPEQPEQQVQQAADDEEVLAPPMPSDVASTSMLPCSSNSSQSTEKSSDKTPKLAQSGTTASVTPAVFDNLDDISAAVDGTMMKYTVADLIEREGNTVESEQSLIDTTKHQYPFQNLSQMECVIPNDAVIMDGIAAVDMRPSDDNVFDMLRSLAEHARPDDSDDETNSLFDSDDDYEGERDDFFRDRSKRKKVKRLTSTKGIIDFKEYIHGTPGEVNWNLWIDIERACLIPNKNELSSFLHAMRERYQVTGAPYELSKEVKIALGLEKPSAWTLKKLRSIHYKVAEPLILYWGPRYLVHQQMKVNTKKHRKYTLQRRLRTPDICTSYPDPPKPNLMPLRPKTCLPRMQQDTFPLPSCHPIQMDIKEPQIQKVIAVPLQANPPDAKRPLLTGNEIKYGNDADVKRTCSLPDINVAQHTKMLKDLANMEQLKVQPWANQAHFMPLTSKELVKYGHIPPLPAKLRESWVNESVVSMFPYAALRPTVICPPALQPPSTKAVMFRSSRTPSTHTSSICTPSIDQLSVATTIDRQSRTLTLQQESASNDTQSIRRASSPLQDYDDSVVMSATPEVTSVTPLAASETPKAGSATPDMLQQSENVLTLLSPDIPEPVESNVSEFLGSRRMEGLLQALANERNSGLYLRSFIKNANCESWVSNLNFWEDLQDYHMTFHCDILEPFTVIKKAKLINSKYIISSAPQHIGCPKEVSAQISQQLDPPYEDLFDEAEEYSLLVLSEGWKQSLLSDSNTFHKVELAEEHRLLIPRTAYLESLQESGVIEQSESLILLVQPVAKKHVKSKKEVAPAETKEAQADELTGLHPPPSPRPPPALPVGEEDPVYDDGLVERIPDKFREWNLEKLVHNRMELQHFREYLAENYASTDLSCWLDIEAYRRTSYAEEKLREDKAHNIQTKYLNKKYFFGPNSPAGKITQAKVISMAGGWGKLLDMTVPPATLLEAQKYVRQRLEKKWLPLFLATSRFAERQRPETGLDNITEDLLIQKRRKSQALYKLLDSKWMSSSKDILTFRKALVNPVTSLQFRRFVTTKGDLFENDVLFWQEIQKYKELCHLHSDRALIQQKTMVIISCFIDSPIPPSLQVDIPADMGERILERKMEATPYLFREAQLTVFRVLFAHWPDFCTFRSDLTKTVVLPTVERNRQHVLKLKHKEGDKEDKDIDLEPSDLEAKDSLVSWTYSQYIEALEKEEALNKTEEETFLPSAKKIPEAEESEFDDDDDDSATSIRTLRKTTQAPSLKTSITSIAQHVPVPPSASRSSLVHTRETKFRPQARIVRRSQQVD